MFKFSREKKSKGAVSLQSMGDVALTIGISIVIIVAVAKIVGKMQETEDFQANSVLNESRNFVANNTPYALANPSLKSISGVTMWNDSAHSYAYPTGAYSYNATYIWIITNGTAEGDFNITTGTHYFNYVSYGRTLAYNISGTGLQAIKDLVDWFPILVVVIVAVLVIYLITGGFGGRTRRYKR